jgi:hypothetical protein
VVTKEPLAEEAKETTKKDKVRAEAEASGVADKAEEEVKKPKMKALKLKKLEKDTKEPRACSPRVRSQ